MDEEVTCVQSCAAAGELWDTCFQRVGDRSRITVGREMEAARGEQPLKRSGLRGIWESGWEGTVRESLLQDGETSV